jgi:hypothetical protein
VSDEPFKSGIPARKAGSILARLGASTDVIVLSEEARYDMIVLNVHEARALRDWLNEVLPSLDDSAEKPK